MKSKLLLTSVLSTMMILFCAASSSSQILFTASLSGSQETPPNPSHATGTAWVLLSADMTTLTYRVTYAQLESTYTGAHFHVAPPGVPGLVVNPLTFDGNTVDGSWTAFPDSILSNLFKGNVYVNVHSQKYPGGEIRGQLVQTSGMGFTLSLDASQETTPNSSPSTGTGFAYFDSANTLKYRVTIAGLSSALTASHFHLGAPGVPGLVVNEVAFTDSTTDGVWAGFPDSLYGQAARGLLYVNVHSSNHPSGEIRGQLESVTGQRFTIALDGSQETPPNVSNATATGWAILNRDASSLTYQFTYAQLDSPFTASHFHSAPPGVKGSVVMPINFIGNTASGVWSNIPDSLVAELLKGNIYTNIHSMKYPGGEIRGQLYAEEAPVLTLSANAAQETPPTNSGGMGTGFVVLDSTALKIHYRVTIAGMDTTVTMAHFHLGAPGVPGNVVQAIAFTDSLSQGDWLGYADDVIPELMKNGLYINVHTLDFPGGEIRGQVMYQQVTVTAVEPVRSASPQTYKLEQNYPNPFNPSTTILFSLPSGTHVTLKVYNLLGQEVSTLVDGFRPTGAYRVTFNGGSLASGVYFYQLNDGNKNVISRKMLLLK